MLYLFLARLYESTGRAIAVTTASASASTSTSTSVLVKMLKFLVKVFTSLCPLKPWMELVDLSSSFWFKFFGSLYLLKL